LTQREPSHDIQKECNAYFLLNGFFLK
jgi:hypothetical protein